MCKDMSFSHTLSQTDPNPIDARTVILEGRLKFKPPEP